MLNKSDTLQRVLKLVDEYRRADNKKAISSDYFMAVFLRLLSMKREDTLPLEFKNEEAIAELSAAEELFDLCGRDEEKIADAILSAVKAEGYNSSMDEFVFAKYAYGAEGTAKKHGLDLITVSVYIELILKEPTASIKKYLLSVGDEKVEGEDDEALYTLIRETVAKHVKPI